VVKPRYGNHGRGVTTNLTTREQVAQAFAAAREQGEEVIVERYVPGADYRLLVVGGRLVAAALREPPAVVGDGRSTVSDLVAAINRDPRRSDGHGTALSVIKLDAVARATLAEQGHSPDSVPAAGERVLIRRNANLSSGGTATDVTDRVHPTVAAGAVGAARAVGLDIAGVDVVAPAIDRPLEQSGGAVVEVNAGPGLRMHLEPSAGAPRPVGDAIVEMLFPNGQTGRIPTVAVTGVNGKTTTTRLIAHLLRESGRVVGMTCTDGIYIDGRRTEKNNCSGPRSARAVLQGPRVDAAVLETARGGILREGLGLDTCDVAVVTNIGKGDHLSPGGTRTLEELARVKRTVVEAVAPGGTAVLNAADAPVAAMARYCPGEVAYFARDGDHPVLSEHRRGGGRAAFVRSGSIVLVTGDREEQLAPLSRVPLAHQGKAPFQVENVLAAVAAVRALGLPLEVIRAGLTSFSGDARQAPGRFNVFEARGASVIVDYAHNPSALEALLEALAHIPHRRRSIVFTGCGRGDADHAAMGEAVGNGFDQVILCTDRYDEAPRPAEYEAQFRRGLTSGSRVAQTREARSEQAGVEAALADLRPGDLVVLGVGDLEGALAYVQTALGPDR
jgi:cyanophycin synthetase